LIPYDRALDALLESLFSFKHVEKDTLVGLSQRKVAGFNPKFAEILDLEPKSYAVYRGIFGP
jgi:hypothetical protein